MRPVRVTISDCVLTLLRSGYRGTAVQISRRLRHEMHLDATDKAIIGACSALGLNDRRVTRERVGNQWIYRIADAFAEAIAS